MQQCIASRCEFQGLSGLRSFRPVGVASPVGRHCACVAHPQIVGKMGEAIAHALHIVGGMGEAISHVLHISALQSYMP